MSATTQMVQMVQSSMDDSSNDESGTLSNHQCLLFDALSVSNCMSTGEFMIETLIKTLQESVRLPMDSFEPREPHFFQSRAPPFSIL
jgi:hypothetical protein